MGVNLWLALALTVAQPVATPLAARPGDVLLLTVGATSSEAPAVHAFDRAWPVFSEGTRWQVLVGVAIGTKTGRHEIVVTGAGERVVHPVTVRPRAFATRRLTVDPALLNPPPEAMERIARETRELAAVWQSSSPQRLWSGAFVRPVPDEANSAFGTRSIYNGEPRSQHTGADFLSPSGRPIKAPNAGRVVLAGARYFTGNTVVIDHGLGLFSLFAHLSEIDVAVDDEVTAGQVVGKVGATGRVTGAHLHWTVRLNDTPVDPVSLLRTLSER